LDADPFSCCESMQALEDLYVVLVEIVRALNLGIPQRLELMSLLQQFQGIISRYIACLACEPGPTGPTG
ncbi:hypothetical protein COI63_35850, partial [Bacillus toyonensis]|uniref:hypothetical protein n=1 Tax=Bacillus toyonensis TaxID=155322 RepID=UPI000C022EFE